MKPGLILITVAFILLPQTNVFTQPNQSATVDSLLQVLTETSDNKAKAGIYRTLTRMFAYRDSDRSLEYAQEAIRQSRAAKDEEGTADGLQNLFNVHFMSGAPTDSLLVHLKRAESQVRSIGDSLRMYKIYQNYSLYYSRLGQADKELEYDLKSLDLIREYVKDPEVEAQILVNIGVTFNNMEQLGKALEYFDQALVLDVQNEHTKSKAYMQLGAVYFKRHQLDSAKVYFEDALDFFQVENNLHEIIKAKISLGWIYDEWEEFSQAAQYYQTALELAEKHDILILLPDSYAAFADHYYQQEQYDLAIQYGQRYLELISESQNHFVQAEYLEVLHKSYAKLGQHTRAYEIRDLLAAVRDSVKTEQHLRQLMKLESDFLVQEQTNKNQLLAAENRIAKNELYNTRSIAAVLFLAFVLAGGWGYSVYRAKRQERKYNEQLELTVQERTAALHDSNRHLEQANYELRVFSYIASHDIKEPIRNIGSYVGLIKRNLPLDIQKELAEYFSTIGNSTEQLYTLIEDFARYTSLSQGEEVGVQPIDLQVLMQRVEAALSVAPKEKKGVLIVEDLPTIRSNSSLLFIALKHLTENGFKYNDSASPCVKISYQNTPSCHEIVVSDNGIGIDSKYHDQIFEMFKRLHGQGRYGYKGSGIGLAIVKLVMDRLGGQVRVESEAEKGSHFILSLPR